MYCPIRVRLSKYWFILLLLLMAAMPARAERKPVVFVSVLPQKHFVEQIGGEHVEVHVMVQPGYSPATYEPTPRQISKLAKAGLYIRTGVPFETAWMSRIQGVNPAMKTVDARDGLALRELTAHDHDHEHPEDEHHKDVVADKDEAADHDTPVPHDPHIWASPRMVVTMAGQIRDELTKLSPEQQALFAANHQRFVQELKALDQELTDLFAESEQHKFMVFHPSWGYMADAYGLEQIAIESEGKEPGAKALAALIRQARAEGVKTIFVQPQFDKRAAEQVAKAIKGNVVAIDPLAENYTENLRKTAHLIAGVADE